MYLDPVRREINFLSPSLRCIGLSLSVLFCWLFFFSPLSYGFPLVATRVAYVLLFQVVSKSKCHSTTPQMLLFVWRSRALF